MAMAVMRKGRALPSKMWKEGLRCLAAEFVVLLTSYKRRWLCKWGTLASKSPSVKFVCVVTKQNGELLQGWTKMLWPGLVNLRRKNCVPLAAVGRRTQFSSSNSPNLAEAF